MRLGLGRDEAAYWYWAWHALDAAYSLVTVGLVRFSTALLGDAPLAIRLPGILAGVATIVLVAAGTRKLGGSRSTALAAAMAVAASPWHMYVGVVTHPDSFLTLFGLAFAVAAALPRRPRDLPLAAGSAAMAALAKLPGLWFLATAAWLLRERPTGSSALAARVAATSALAVSGLVMLRDADGGVLAGVREFGRFAEGVSLLERVAWTLGEVVVCAGPALVVLAGAGAAALRDARVRRAWPAWTAAGALLVFFTAFHVEGESKGNWFLPAFVLLAPPGAVALERLGRGRLVRRLALAGSVTMIVVSSLATNPELIAAALQGESLAPLDASYLRHVGSREAAVSPARAWSDRLREYVPGRSVDTRVWSALSSEATGIASDDYGLAFRAAHAAGRDVRVYLPGDPIFRRSCGGRPGLGDTIVFVSSRRVTPWPGWCGRFESCRAMGPLQGDWPLPAGDSPSVSPQNVWLCVRWRAGGDGGGPR